MPKKKGVPEDWLSYTPLGDRITGTPFVASKTPLSEKLLKSLPPEDHFTAELLIKAIQMSGQTLKLVIDLTATNRYYDPAVYSCFGVDYVKIAAPGGVMPVAELRADFNNEVTAFKERWNYSPEREEVICVHCTHGVNRAGYFICNYLIAQEDWSPEEAIRKFEIYRGHKIEHAYLLGDLRNSSGGDPFQL